MDSLGKLLKYAIENNLQIIKHLAILTLCHSDSEETIKLSKSLLSESIDIDLWELESLVNPKKFDYEKPDITMRVDLDE